MHDTSVQVRRDLHRVLQPPPRVRRLPGGHRAKQPLDLGLHRVLGDVREVFPGAGGCPQGTALGLQLLGPAQGPRGTRPLPAVSGEGVRDGEPPLRGGRLEDEEAVPDRRGRGVPRDLEAVPGAGRGDAGQRGRQDSQDHGGEHEAAEPVDV